MRATRVRGPELRVHHPAVRRWRWLALATTVVVATVALAWALDLLAWTDSRARLHAARTTASLWQWVVESREQNAQLRSAIARAEQVAGVERRAKQSLAAEVARMQGELMALRRELALYRGVVEAAPGARGLQLYRVLVQPDGERDRYRYDVVLLDARNGSRTRRGRLEMSFIDADGRRRQALARLAEGGAAALEFRMAHFRRLQGRFTLPEGFAPRTVRVAVRIDGRREAALVRSFPWERLLQGVGGDDAG